jgi:hypothetical protein
MEVTGQLHAPAALSHRERAAGTHWRGGLVGPKAGLVIVVKKEFPASAGNRILRTVSTLKVMFITMI